MGTDRVTAYQAMPSTAFIQGLNQVTIQKVHRPQTTAAHYHELTAMEGTLPGVKNYNIAVRTRGEEIVFLRKIVPGGADRSYGIEVAKLAGLPEAVVSRARKILRQLEEESGRPAAAPAPREDQVSFAAVAEGEVIDRLRRTQVDSLTPLEALQLLYELKKKLT